jgi:hypothetical protein
MVFLRAIMKMKLTTMAGAIDLDLSFHVLDVCPLVVFNRLILSPCILPLALRPFRSIFYLFPFPFLFALSLRHGTGLSMKLGTNMTS